MNNPLYKLVLLGLLLMFVLAPFAGFAPLLLVLLVAGVYWFIAPIVQAFFYGEQREISYQEDITDKK